MFFSGSFTDMFSEGSNKVLSHLCYDRLNTGCTESMQESHLTQTLRLQEVMSKLKWKYHGRGSLEVTGYIRGNGCTSTWLEIEV